MSWSKSALEGAVGFVVKLLLKARNVPPEVDVGVPVCTNAGLTVELNAGNIAAAGDMLLIEKV